MLPVVNRVTLACLAGRQLIQIPAARDRQWLGAQHGPDADTTGPSGAPGHEHSPIDAAELMCAVTAGAMDVARLVQELRKRAPVEHQFPAPPGVLKSVHRRHVRQPRRSRCVTVRKQRHRIAGGLMFVLRLGRCRFVHVLGQCRD